MATRRQTLKYAGGLITASSSVAVAGCLDDGSSSGGTVNIGSLAVMTQAGLYIADQLGHFEDQGLETEFEHPSTTGDILAFVGQGQVDVGGAGPGAGFLNAVDGGLPISAVAQHHSMTPADQERGSDRLVSRSRDDSIQEVADLEGKTVSFLDHGNTTSWHVEVGLSQGGLTLDDVDVRTMPFPDMVPALENEAIDACHLAEPLATVAQGDVEGGVNELVPNLNAGSFATAIYYNTNWAENNPDDAESFLIGYVNGVRELYERGWHDEEILQILNEYTEIPTELLSQTVEPYIDPNVPIPEEDLNAIQQSFINRDQVDYDQPIEYDELVDTQYRDNAIDELGEY